MTRAIYSLARRRCDLHPALLTRLSRRDGFRLEENFRSTGHILSAANAVIAADAEPARQDAVHPQASRRPDRDRPLS